MRAGRKRKVTLGREPNGRVTRTPIDRFEQWQNAAKVAQIDEFERHAVYVICPVVGDNPCKIGVSNDPEARLVTLQTSVWMKLKVAHVVWVGSAAAAFGIERFSHKQLLEEGRGLLGEWFGINSAHGHETIMWAVNKLGAKVIDASEKIDYAVRNIQ